MKSLVFLIGCFFAQDPFVKPEVKILVPDKLLANYAQVKIVFGNAPKYLEKKSIDYRVFAHETIEKYSGNPPKLITDHCFTDITDSVFIGTNKNGEDVIILGEGEYQLLISANYLYCIKDDKNSISRVNILSDFISRKIVLGKPKPPVPPVPPTPPTPPHDELTEFVKSEFAKISVDGKVIKSGIRDNFIKIGNSSHGDVESATQALYDMNVKTQGNLKPYWLEFFVALEKYLNQMRDKGQLLTITDFKKVCLLIADGLI